jgi:hypothetical protein
MPTTSDMAEDIHDSNRLHIRYNDKGSGFITNTNTAAARREQEYLGMKPGGDQGVATAPGTETKNLIGPPSTPTADLISPTKTPFSLPSPLSH